MKKQYLWAVPALALLAGCTKNDNPTEMDGTRSTAKVIAEYLDAEYPEVNEIIGGEVEYVFSEEGVFTAAGGSRTVTTNLSFKGRTFPGGTRFDSEGKVILKTKNQMNEFKLYIDGVDQMICTADQSDAVKVEEYPLFRDGVSEVRVPNNGVQRKVRYDDGTYGYIPDSVSVSAYPIAGAGYTGVQKYMETAPVLIAGITGPWFKVTSNALNAYTKKEVPFDYFEGDGSKPEHRIRYTNRGLIQERFMNVGTTYIYLTEENQSMDTQFTVEVSPNTTGPPPDFYAGVSFRSLFKRLYSI